MFVQACSDVEQSSEFEEVRDGQSTNTNLAIASYLLHYSASTMYVTRYDCDDFVENDL